MMLCSGAHGGGAVPDLRNAKIDMYKGSMRLAVNQWGVIEKTADQPDFDVKVRMAPDGLCSAYTPHSS